MSDDRMPPQVQAFIFEYIHSVAQLEILLHIMALDPAAVSPAAAATKLRLSEPWAADQMADMARCALLKREAAGYRFAPASEAARAAAHALAHAYTDRRVAVIGLIYNKPSPQLRAFSDAFRLGSRPQEPPNG
ncbi:MAG: hypothetical protein IT437_05135 [Phycisphaerales bacterium]|nr:hypothetical protein [Phycisphaerales bacterium]